LEELLPKDNESIHLPLDGPVLPTEPVGFTHEQMIRCDECLRANPPTRISCLYCGSALPHTEQTAKLRRPTLRQPEKHEPGFNCILLNVGQTGETDGAVSEASSVLKLSPDKLKEIIETRQPLPLARTASRDEADLVIESLKELGIEAVTLSDDILGFQDELIVRVRSMQLEDDRLVLHVGGSDPLEIAWTNLGLIVSGRIVVTKVEVKERLSRRAEKEILDTSHFFTDEPVFDLYTSDTELTYRIGAKSFDFSCLNDQKTLVAGENLKRLHELIVSRVASIKTDDSYSTLRNTLVSVWPFEQETQSQGWRRERPGKYSLGAATVNSNETQFNRHSRLRRYITLR
jgi:hypothetical protein